MAKTYDFLKDINNKYSSEAEDSLSEPVQELDESTLPIAQLNTPEQEKADKYRDLLSRYKVLRGEDSEFARYGQQQMDTQQDLADQEAIRKLGPANTAFQQTNEKFEAYPTDKSYDEINADFGFGPQVEENVEQAPLKTTLKMPSSPTAESLPSVITQPLSSEPSNLMARYSAALKQRDKQQSNSDFLRLLGSAANAVSGTNVTTLADLASSKEKRASQGISDIDNEMQLQKGEIGLGDEKSKRDPNSETSKAARDLMNRMGMPQAANRSAHEIFQIAPMLEKYLSQQANLEARKEARSEKAEYREKEHKKKVEENFIPRAQKTANKLVEDFTKINQSVSKIEHLLSQKVPSGYQDMLAFFAAMKAADPGSTVRESEYSTMAKTGSVVDRASNLINSVVNGQKMTEQQRTQLKEAMRIIKDSAKKEAAKLVEPLRNEGKKYEVEEQYWLNPDLRDSNQQQKTSSLKVGTVEDGHEYIGGDPSSQESWKKVK